MHNSLLTFRGNAVQARAALVPLLESYKTAFFEEVDAGVYAVRATPAVLQDIAKRQDWEVRTQ